MRAKKFLLFCYLSCLILAVSGCDDQAAMEARQQTEKARKIAQEFEEESQRAKLELENAGSELEQSRQAAKEAKQQAADLEAKYLEAKQKAEQAESVANELAQKLEVAQQKIDAAKRLLADESSAGQAVAKVDLSSFSARFFSWNVESEGADPKVIADQLPKFGSYDVYGLTEVLPESFELFRSSLGDKFASIDSKTGRNDRMQIIFNAEKFELLRNFELDEINFENRYRSPVVAHLRDKTSGVQFLVLINHLARGKAEVRAKQATQLMEWARNQNLPIVALGDYNYDYVFADDAGNEGFNNMLRDGIWLWVKPAELIDTNWFDNPSKPDGKDDYPGSMLDFAFVAGSAKDWKLTCNVIVRDGDFPDDQTTSDHRPFELLVEGE